MQIRFVRGFVLLLVFIVLGLAAPAQHGIASPRTEGVSLIKSMLDQVSLELVEQYTGDLSGAWEVTINGSPYTIETRHALSGEPAAKAALYLYQFYQDLGLPVQFDYFSFNDQTLSNIVSEKEGSVFPERIS